MSVNKTKTSDFGNEWVGEGKRRGGREGGSEGARNKKKKIPLLLKCELRASVTEVTGTGAGGAMHTERREGARAGCTGPPRHASAVQASPAAR